MRRTDSEGLSRRLGQKQERNSLLTSERRVAEMLLEVTAEKYDLLLRLTDYKVSKENFKRRLSEEKEISKVMTAS